MHPYAASHSKLAPRCKAGTSTDDDPRDLTRNEMRKDLLRGVDDVSVDFSASILLSYIPLIEGWVCQSIG